MFQKTFRLFWIVIFQRSPQYCCKIEILAKYWNKNKSKINGLRCFMFLKMFHFGLRWICRVIFGIFLWLLNNIPNTGCLKGNQIVTFLIVGLFTSTCFYLKLKIVGTSAFDFDLKVKESLPLSLDKFIWIEIIHHSRSIYLTNYYSNISSIFVFSSNIVMIV